MYSLISKTTTKPSIMVTQGLDVNPPNYAMLSIAANHNLWVLDTKDGSIFQLIKTTDKETGETKFLVSPTGLIRITDWEEYFPEKYKMPKNEEENKKMYMDEGDYIIFNAKSYSKIFNPDSNE
jgi:streptogramin lyase